MEQVLLSESIARGPEAITRSWQLVLDKLPSPLLSQLTEEKFYEMNGLTPVNLSVLVVEDQAFQQQALNALLRVYSQRYPFVTFSVEMVDSAAAAMRLMQTRRDWNVVILDVVMPEVSGDALLPSIRQLLGDQVAVIMVSALRDINLIQRCIFSGADSFLVKPLQLQSIAQLWQLGIAKSRRLLSNPSSRSRPPLPCTRSPALNRGSGLVGSSCVPSGDVASRVRPPTPECVTEQPLPPTVPREKDPLARPRPSAGTNDDPPGCLQQ